MKHSKLALAGAFALVCALPAVAQTSSTLPVKDNSLTVRQVAGQQEAAGAFHYRDIMEGLTSTGAPDPLLTDGLGHAQVVLFGAPNVGLTAGASAGAGQRHAVRRRKRRHRWHRGFRGRPDAHRRLADSQRGNMKSIRALTGIPLLLQRVSRVGSRS